MHSRRFDTRQQRGAALVAALLVFALCTSLIVAMKSEFLRFYQRGANLFIAEQGLAYLRGAEELARRALLEDEDQDLRRGTKRDDLQEIWAQTPVPYDLDEGGWLMGSLTDLQGRFNLNALAAGRGLSLGGEKDGQDRSPAQDQFIRLLQALEEPAVSRQQAIRITNAVSDWLDADQNRRPGGAEDDVYIGRTPAYRTANRPMASTSELLAVAHITPEIYAAIRDSVTVWPSDPAPLNIHTATPLLLRSLNVDGNLRPLPPSEVESLLATRESAGFADVDDFLAQPAFAGKDKQLQGLKSLLGESSSYFLLQAEAKVADRQMRLYSVLKRENRDVTALVRAAGSL